MRNVCIILALSLFTASWAHAQPVNTFLIDNFNNTIGTTDVIPDPTLDGNAAWANFGNNPTPLSQVLGGRRLLGNFLTEVSGGGPFTNSTNIGSGVFSIDNPFNTRSSGQVSWDGGTNTSLPTGGIIGHPVNFNLGNLNFDTIVATPGFYFQWSVINADTRTWNYTIRAYTNNSSNYFEATIETNATGGALVSIPRSAFVVGAGSPSWTDIDAITFAANYVGQSLGGDLAVDFFQIAVPEMSTYLMLGLMLLLGGAFYAYRYGKQGEAQVAAEGEAKEVTPDVEQPAAQPVVA